MVAEAWLVRMGNQVSNNIKNSFIVNNNRDTQQQISSSSSSTGNGNGKQIIGILSFEVANVMSKLVHLHKSVSDEEIWKLKKEIIKSEGINRLVSSDECYLLQLAFAERIDDLHTIAGVVSRLGSKCTHPALLGFQHVYADLTCGKIQLNDLGFLVKDMDSMIRKLHRFVSSTSNLYAQLEVLNQLQQASSKFNHNTHSRRAFHQKLSWQRHDVSHLRDISLWNQTYDKVVELLARTVCTLYATICAAFTCTSSSSPSCSTPLVKTRDFDLLYPCAPSPARIFMECLTSASTVDDQIIYPLHSHSLQFGFHSNNTLHQPELHSSINPSAFGPKTRLSAHATPSTVGGSALALHYANLIIVIQKLLRYPHLVGDEARDDLYQMLPSTLRKSLRINLKSNFNNFAIFDAAMAHHWKENLDHILNWLAPLAHNMIRWQSERNFEQQQIVTRTNALLLQTLYFADREKTESAICDLLVGLNYICRYEHQQNALLDCASSFDFGDWMDWQLQCQASCFD